MKLSDLQKKTLREFAAGDRKLTVLTGAGISADSGIPTFRGKEGFWVVGSKNYQPEEMGTRRMYVRQPLEVWKWFLFRRTICDRAEPNPGHHAIVQLEKIFGERFQLITQNVDGLHQRAGSDAGRLFSIHGTLEKMRCGRSCSKELFPFPAWIKKERGDDLSAEEIEALKCPNCGKCARPHVLWFDEFYDEANYKLESSLRVAGETGLLLVVGTSGATNLPQQIVQKTLRSDGVIMDINIDGNPFAQIASESVHGHALQGPSSEILTEIADFFQDLESDSV